MKIDVQQEIEDAHRVIEVFGEWPSFHDAEVISVTLNRGNRVSTLEASIYVFSMLRSKLDPTRFDFTNEMVVTLVFERIVLHKLGDFNHQNSIDGLEIEPSSKGSRKWEVNIDGSNGCTLHFECDAIRVANIQPWTPTA